MNFLRFFKSVSLKIRAIKKRFYIILMFALNEEENVMTDMKEIS